MRRSFDTLLVSLTAATVFDRLGHAALALEGFSRMFTATSTALAGLAAATDSPVWLKILKDVAATLQSLATIAALIVGAWWVLKRRRIYPRAKFTHTISEVGLDDGRTLLHVAIVIENVGDVLLPLGTSVVCAQQLSPLPSEHKERLLGGGRLLPDEANEVDWPILDRCDQNWQGNEFEPGESGAFHFDLIAPAGTKTVLIYSYFTNLAKRARGEIGWNTSTVYHIGGDVAAAPESEVS